MTETIALQKGKHRFVFNCGPADEGALLDRLVVLANRQAMGFDFVDAAVVAYEFGECFAKARAAHPTPAGG